MYYTVQSTTSKEGTVANAVFNFATLDAAKQNHYYFLSSSVGNANLSACLGVILDSRGLLKAHEEWHASDEIAGEQLDD